MPRRIKSWTPDHPLVIGKDGYAVDRQQRHAHIIACRGAICALCGWRGKVAVDHIDGNRANYAPINLRVLCVSCNNKAMVQRTRPSRFGAEVSKKERHRLCMREYRKRRRASAQS